MRIKQNTLLTFFMLLVLFASVQSFLNPLFVVEETLYHYELFDLRGVVKGSIYLFTYLSAILVFLLILSLKSTRAFLFFLLLIFLASSIDFFVQFLGVSHGFSLDEFRLSMHEMGNYEFLFAYSTTILKALFLALFLVVILFFIRQKIYKKRVSLGYLLLALLPMSVVYGACYKIDTFKLSSYPAMVKLPLIAVDYARVSSPIKERILAKNINAKNESSVENIVWIIDESVTASYLSINGYAKKTTPYLEALEKNSSLLSNFGIASSISNCSSTSNLFLRIGMSTQKEHNIAKEMFDMPTIFQYAQRAGYNTWLFDSQTQKDRLQNYLTLYDKKSIEHFETLNSSVKREEKDLELLKSVAKVTQGKGKNFIVVVKYGAHFPYLTTYDHAFSPFKPVLEGSFEGMTWQNKEKQINTYLNSLHYTVDMYLKRVVETVDLENSVVFYTSDHGQNILESKNLSRTHCNSANVVRNEVSVPLMVFSKNAKELFPVSREKFYSHIQIFPTTLELLGYDNEVVKKYGKSLKEGFEKSSDRAYILSSSLKKEKYK